MLRSWGQGLGRLPWPALGAWLILAIGGAIVLLTPLGATSALHQATVVPPTVPGSQTAQVAQASRAPATAGPVATLAITGTDLADATTAQALAKAMEAPRARLAALPGVAVVIDPFALPKGLQNPAAKQLIQRDSRGFLISVELKPDLTDRQSAAAIDRLIPQLKTVASDLAEVSDGAKGLIGADPLVAKALQSQARHSLKWGTVLALALALILSLGALGARWRAIPALAAIAVGTPVTLAVISLLDRAHPSTANALGSAMQISIAAFALLSVPLAARMGTERRRELNGGEGTAAGRHSRAIGAAMGSAGPGVALAGLSAIAVQACLMVFAPQEFKEAGRYGALGTTLALLAALTLVPALAGLLGERIGAQPGSRLDARLAAWRGRIDARLTARWRPIAGLALAALVVMALPAGALRLTETAGTAPPDSSQQAFQRLYAAQYSAAETAPIRVLAQTTIDAAGPWAAKLAQIRGVKAITEPAAAEGAVMLGLWPATSGETGPAREQARAIVTAIRAQQPGFQFAVAGQAASELDLASSIKGSAPTALGLALAACLAALVLAARGARGGYLSFLALAAGVLAALGAGGWMLAGGHGATLLGYPVTAGIEFSIFPMALMGALSLGMLLLAPALAASTAPGSGERGPDQAVATSSPVVPAPGPAAFPAGWCTLIAAGVYAPMALQVFGPLAQLGVLGVLAAFAIGGVAQQLLLPALAAPWGARAWRPVIRPRTGSLAPAGPAPRERAGRPVLAVSQPVAQSDADAQVMRAAITPAHGIDLSTMRAAPTPPGGISLGDTAERPVIASPEAGASPAVPGAARPIPAPGDPFPVWPPRDPGAPATPPQGR